MNGLQSIETCKSILKKEREREALYIERFPIRKCSDMERSISSAWIIFIELDIVLHILWAQFKRQF